MDATGVAPVVVPHGTHSCRHAFAFMTRTRALAQKHFAVRRGAPQVCASAGHGERGVVWIRRFYSGR